MGIMQASHVFLDSSAATRDEALKFVADKAAELGVAESAEAALAAFQRREEQGTTGMQDGFAIPHAKDASIKQVAVFVVKFAAPITDWDSLDKKPIETAIALLVPAVEAGTTHIQLLAKTAKMLMSENFRTQLKGSSDPDEIAALVNGYLDE